MRNILLGDLLNRLEEFPDNYFDSVVTDPPYGLSFMGKKWDAKVPSVGEWIEILRVLKPGGYLLAFGGTRTYHRMVVNIEDAGFEIRDQLAWLYSSGFPKSVNMGDGMGTALKPAMEPIVMARKPLDGTLENNFLKYGTGVLYVDKSRIPFLDELDMQSAIFGTGIDIRGGNYNGDAKKTDTRRINPNILGRFPSNVLLDEEAGQILNDQTGVLKSGTAGVIGKSAKGHQGVSYQKDNREAGSEIITYGDAGGASRFFYCAKPSKEERHAGTGLPDLPLKRSSILIDMEEAYWNNPKGNFHPTIKPISLMRYLVRMVTRPGAICLDPYAGSGSTGIACEFEQVDYILIEKEETHIPIIEKRLRYWTVVASRERRREAFKKSQITLF